MVKLSFHLNKRLLPTSRANDILNIRKNWQRLVDKNHYQNNFQLKISSSSICNAGLGVFCKGAIYKHDLITFYPGRYYPPIPTYAIMNSIGDTNDTSTCMYVRQVNNIDNSSYQIHCNHIGGFIEGLSASCLTSYCVGHLVNHPPPSMTANARPVDFHWHDIIDTNVSSQHNIKAINSIGAGVWYVDPMTFEAVDLGRYHGPCGGLALIATRDIHDGDEIFLDYRYDRSSSLPSWYHLVS